MFTAKRLMYSTDRCWAPGEEKLSGVGFSLASLINSGAVFAGKSVLTTRMKGDFT